MNIDINGARYIESNRLNWYVRDGTRVNKGKNDIRILGCFGSLRTALEQLAAGEYGRIHGDDLAALRQIVQALDDACLEIQRAFATPNKLRELVSLKIAFECAGFRFVVSDRWNVDRQERGPKGGKWKSKSYYISLGHALADTLVERSRLSGSGNLKDTLAVIRGFRAEILAAKRHLPADYWGGSHTPPFKPLLKTPVNALAGRLHRERPAAT